MATSISIGGTNLHFVEVIQKGKDCKEICRVSLTTLKRCAQKELSQYSCDLPCPLYIAHIVNIQINRSFGVSKLHHWSNSLCVPVAKHHKASKVITASTKHFDFTVIGSGVAGLLYALAIICAYLP